MSYKLFLTEEAERNIMEWRESGQKKTLIKITSLFEELQEHPGKGTGRVEKLKGNLQGLWSRRIDKKPRLVYSINEKSSEVTVISMKGHYSD